MKRVIYKDKDNFLRRSLVKDNDPSSYAEYGVPDGPPDLRSLDWDAILREANNLMVELGLFSWDEIRRSPTEFGAVLNVFKKHIVAAYRQDALDQKNIRL